MRSFQISAASLSCLVLALAVVVATGPRMAVAADAAADRWAKAMAAFDAADGANPHPPGGIVFVGSSSIRMWNLKDSFPSLQPTPLNRGFGGSEIRDSVRHFDLLIAKHKPKLVVLYAGDNDMARGLTAKQVHADFLEFAAKLKAALPDTRLAYVAIKPSIARWKLATAMNMANNLIRESCEEQQQLEYLDIWQPMLGKDGRPRPELFRNDGLHMNAAGYEIWNDVTKPFLLGKSLVK